MRSETKREKQEVTKMKHLFLNSLAALATLAVSVPMASAQTLTGTVPFAFAIDARRVLPAGNYVVIKTGGHWQFRNQDVKNTVFITGNPEESRRNDPAQLVFACRGNHCALRQIQAGGGQLGYSVPPARVSRASALELARVVSIPLAHSEGD
jgi:hypothetical protein